MKQFFVDRLKEYPEITDFFMVKSIGVKTGANKKQYLDVLLGDKTGEVNAKKWDVSEAEEEEFSGYSEGDLIKVKAQVTDW